MTFPFRSQVVLKIRALTDNQVRIFYNGCLNKYWELEILGPNFGKGHEDVVLAQ